MNEKYLNNIEKIIRKFKMQKPYAKVGVLRKDTNRSDNSDQQDNATVGAYHEFGTKHIEQRSFLRVPIQDNLQKILEKFEKEKNLDLVELTKKIGAACKSIVQEGFTNNGFGKWAPTQKWTHNVLMGASEKEAGNILVDTGQLRDSINYEVVE